jgi:hypothetical protein
MGPIFQSFRESPPKTRVHVAPEILDDIPPYFRHFRDNEFYEFLPLKDIAELSGGARLVSFPVDHTVTCF